MAWNFTLYKDPQLPKPTLHHVPRMRRTQGPFPEVKWETQVGFCTEKWVPRLGYNVPDALPTRVHGHLQCPICPILLSRVYLSGSDPAAEAAETKLCCAQLFIPDPRQG